ncbi:MAG TPA: peptidase domain-containing ABC transporter [Puia sp.]|uniref:peptidase domain-containing ABC transporter n=1 Tax=Puia sp. TaxID=2045100 RepID=UPI002B83A513|nr:peptidase domain-containing ABC transporter [Puia sp.]HVU98340.1 peptidase domain-containing ABC transporter [Puia sp.]
MPFPFFRQPDSMDCGPTCLQMVAAFYGRKYPLQALRDNAQIGKDGVNLLGISDTAESIGFRTRAVKIDLQSLAAGVALPAILHWDQYHFVVLYKVKRRHFYIADPAAARVRLGEAEFLQRWAPDRIGIALLLEPAPEFFTRSSSKPASSPNPAAPKNHAAPTKPASSAFRSIFSYLRPYKKMVAQLAIGLAVASLLQFVLPFLTKSIVDVGIDAANIHFIQVVLIAQLALLAGRMITEFIRSWILLHISTRINIAILTDFLVKLMQLPLSFFDSKRTGDILQRMNDHLRIESFLTGSSISVLFSVVNLLVFSFVLASFNGYIFLVFLAASICYSAWIIVFMRRRRLLDYRRFDVAAKEQGAAIQMIQGMQEIRLNGVEKQIRGSWEKLQVAAFNLSGRSLSLSQWQQSGAFCINETKNILITFIAASSVVDGRITLGTMIAVQYIIGQLNAPVEQMLSFAQSWQNAKISVDRLNEIHSMPDEEPRHKPLLQTLPPSFSRQLTGGRRADIHLDNVSFTYPGAGNAPVLENISLRIPKGKVTAIVGVSGSGKTTLLKLLLKFYPVQRGAIWLCDTPLDAISHKLWRSHCGVVMQESYIFSDSIARNIAVGSPEPDRGRLDYAVKMANIDSFITSLPLGYDTLIGAEGTGLSAGQRQRILIARAVYRDPDFIFFDEATNSLDAANESIILGHLQAFFNGRTVVVVAHRLSTVKNADQIIVLDKGVIAESGTHRQLLQKKGEYFRLVENQLELGE